MAGKDDKSAKGATDKGAKDKGAKDKGAKDKGADVREAAVATGPERRVELVAPATPDEDRRGPRLGIGLLLSLVIGFGPLRDAALGNGSFTEAMARYLACLAFSVGAVLVLGRLLDGAPAPEEPETPESEDA